MTENNNKTIDSNLEERTVINFFDDKSNNRNWELDLVDPLALENISRRCSEHPKNEVYLSIKEGTSEYDRHGFVGDHFKNMDCCYDCSQNKLDYLYKNESLSRYNRDEKGEIKVSKLSYSDERAKITSPILSKVVDKRSDYIKVMKKEQII